MLEPERLEQAIKLAEQITEKKDTNRLSFYDPYEYQNNFHSAKDNDGRLARQRLLMAANKTGKTFCGAAEMAFHLTGKYPKWWKGYRFTGPIKAWAAGNTTANTRDIVQAELLGEPGDEEDFGKGALPKDVILKWDRQPGIPNAVSTVTVKHASGKNSKCYLKSYEQGKQAWMGKAIDVVWMDEEPPQDIYSQALRASLKSGGLTYMTFTPESGMTNVVAQFMNNLKPHQQLYNATWDDAPHLDDEVKAEILAALPPHERKMRSEGIPVLGSGLVFPIDVEQIKRTAFAIPEHWSRICAIDFGYDHPTAAVWIAHDRDHDVAYVYDTYRKSGETPLVHAQAIKARGDWIPVMWPHDGAQHDKGSGEPLAAIYRRQGMNMFPKHFENPEGGQGVEPGLMEMLQKFQTQRLLVFDHLGEFFEEMRMYHRKDGKVVKERDDLMSAARYAVMSLRYAKGLTFSKRMDHGIGTFDDEYQYFAA
jgi:phage terminase large subunit-like protein